MTIRNVLILGGSGFVGTSIANRLADRNVKVTVPTRRRARRIGLILLPNVEMVEADIHDEETLRGLMVGMDAVINLVGVLHSRDFKLPYSADFERPHVDLPKKIVAACRASGVRRLLHMSALKADTNGPSEYLRSKADGESVVLAAAGAGEGSLDVTVFRPSVIFGAGDNFLNTFAKLLRSAPVFPLGYGHARFQPVYVGDVAESFVRSLEARESFGQAYDLVGPQVYTLRQLVDYVKTLSGSNSRVIALSEFWALLQAGIMWLLPNPPLSPDNLRSMQVDSVADTALPFGLTATPLESVAPTYLVGKAPRVRFDTLRVKAGR